MNSIFCHQIFDFADTLIEGSSDAQIRCDQNKDGSCSDDPSTIKLSVSGDRIGVESQFDMDCSPADVAPHETTVRGQSPALIGVLPENESQIVNANGANIDKKVRKVYISPMKTRCKN